MSSMRKRHLLLACLALLCSARIETHAADTVTVVQRARLHALDDADTFLADGALAFDAHGTILAVGDSGRLRAAYLDARVVDAGGRTLLPGLIDAHGHLEGLAEAMTQADLTGTRSPEEIIERLQSFERGLAPDDWLLGHGWDQNDWAEQRFPDRSVLDRAFPDRPVWLSRIDGHAAWGNSQALAAADRDLGGDWQPPGGRIHRDVTGQPTGIFIDNAMAVVDTAVKPASARALDAALDRAIVSLLAHGLTGVQDPGVGRGFVERLRRRAADGRLPLRVYAMADGPGATLDWLCAEGPFEDPSGRLTMRAVKLYADGALGSRGAALLGDYADEPGNRGLPFHSDAELEDQVRRAMACGLQVAVHAIGDAANRQALDVFARLLPEFPENPGRHRVEHAQVLAPADIPRFGALGIIASMQPTHATSDMYWAGERLGPERLTGAYAWRSLLEGGARLALGSDFPVEGVSPLAGIEAAVTRRDAKGFPPGGWFPAQTLTRAEALRGFTRDAAYAAFTEDSVGSLEPGKRADFILLDRDPVEVPAGEIHRIQVLETWVDGRRVY